MKKLVSLGCFLLFICCKGATTVEYIVSNDYIGPCMIFVYANNTSVKFEEKILLSNGLGRISKRDMKKRFVIKKLEDGSQMDIVPIGKDEAISDSNRHVFQLSKGNFSNGCSSDDISVVSFFVGTKKEYDRWYELHQPEHAFFEMKGVDWCEYFHNPSIE